MAARAKSESAALKRYVDEVLLEDKNNNKN